MHTFTVLRVPRGEDGRLHHPNVNTYSFSVALGSVLHVTMRQAAPGKWTSVVVFVSVTGY